MFIVPLYTILCQSQKLIQFALMGADEGDFADEGDAVPFRDGLRHKYFINKR